MKSHENFNPNGHLQLDDQTEVLFLEPGILATTKRNANIYTWSGELFHRGNEILPVDRYILARPVTKNMVEVTFCSVTKEDNKNKVTILKENGRTKTYYINKKDIKYIDRFKKDHVPLFEYNPRSGVLPNISDIKQFAFENCFLLSAVSTILYASNGLPFIQNMMCESNNNVFMRFYDLASKEPVFVKVLKTEYHLASHDKTILHTGGSWLSYLEKGFASFLCQCKKEFCSYNAAFDEGDYADKTFKILTGCDAKTFTIKFDTIPDSSSLRLGKIDIWNIALIAEGIKVIEKAKNCEKLQPYFNTDKFDQKYIEYLGAGVSIYKEYSEFLNNKYLAYPDYLLWINFIEKIKSMHTLEAQNLIEHLNAMNNKSPNTEKNDTKKPNDSVRISDITKLAELLRNFFKKNKKQYHLFEAIINKISLHCEKDLMKTKPVDKNISSLFGGAIKAWQYGDIGKYTTSQLRFFYDICKNFAENKMQVTGTCNRVPDGFVPKHAYAIFDARIVKNILFVKLHNPWGDTGIKYHYDDKTGEPISFSKEDKVGEFWVEFNDFCKLFISFTLCQPVNNLTLEFTQAAKLYNKSKEKIYSQPEKQNNNGLCAFDHHIKRKLKRNSDSCYASKKLTAYLFKKRQHSLANESHKTSPQKKRDFHVFQNASKKVTPEKTKRLKIVSSLSN